MPRGASQIGETCAGGGSRTHLSPSSQHQQCLADGRCLLSKCVLNWVGKALRWCPVCRAPGTWGSARGCGAHLGAPVAVEPGCGTGPHVTGLSAGGPWGAWSALLLPHFVTIVSNTANLPAPLATPAPYRALGDGEGPRSWASSPTFSSIALNQDLPLIPGSVVTWL